MDDVTLAQALTHGLALGNADPLARMGFVPKQLEYVRAAAGVTESALRAASKLGKSTVAACFVVATARGMTELCGVPLPRLRRSPSPVWWAMTRSYKQQTEGTQAAVRLALGNWPHRIAWQDRGEGTWAAVWIKPDVWFSDDHESWAKLTFVSQQNSRNDADNAKGARLDGVWFDEPGYPAVVAELRKAGRPGWPFRMLHTFTPLRRDEWEAIRRDVEAPALEIREVTASIYDAIRGRVPNGFLSEAEVAELEAKYSTDEHRDARLFGRYCDVTGSTPWSPRALETLNRWLESCEPGRLQRFRIHGEKDGAEGRGLVTETAEVEIAWEPEAGEDYLLVADPAEGIDDGTHDPLALLVVAVRQPRVVAWYTGYVSAHGLGNLAGQLARQYNGALVDPETTGGWGGPFLTGLRSSRYHRVGQEQRPTAPGKFRTDLGFRTTDQTRPLYFSALHQAMLEDSIVVTSRAIVAQLMGIEIDRHGKPTARYGEHDEFAICLGRALSRIASLKALRRPPKPQSYGDYMAKLTIGNRPRRQDNWSIADSP